MTETERADADTGLVAGSTSVELSANRTSLSFERTRMSADRTLMAIVRTSLALISFGFTIYEVFHQLAKRGALGDADASARRLGVSLLVLGVVFLSMGIWSHMGFARDLTRRRARLYGLSLLHTASEYRATPTFAIAILLLLCSLAVLAIIIFRVL